MQKSISLAELRGFAIEFINNHPNGAIVGLFGDLGAGKTTFVREVISILAESAGIPAPRVTSPSYVLYNRYSSLRVHHFDLYRLDNATEASLSEIGYYEAIDESRIKKGFVFVEWPERANPPNLLALDTKLHIAVDSAGNQRIFQLS